MFKTEKELQKEANELMSKLVAMCNCTCGEKREAMSKGMLEALQKEHRTIQQLFIGVLNDTLTKYGDSSTDLRNEQAVKWAKEATSGNTYFPYI